MMGLTLGPVTGLLMAQTLLGDKPEFDMDMMRPDRF